MAFYRRLYVGLGAFAILTAAAGAQSVPGRVPYLPGRPAGAPVSPERGLPATAPTTIQTSANSAVGTSAAMPPVVRPVAPSHRARVRYADGTLEVEADNSSLNEILRQISNTTGMEITGGVTEERVYGSYGPGSAGVVLDQLLAGTGANMLLILDRAEQPAELVLTQRNGGPSPPNPAAAREPDPRDEDPDTPPQLAQHVPAPGTNPQPPGQGEPPPGSLPASSPGSSGDAPAAAATTTEQSPNGVKTPQQIYEQLLKLQQAKAAAPQ